MRKRRTQSVTLMNDNVVRRVALPGSDNYIEQNCFRKFISMQQINSFMTVMLLL